MTACSACGGSWAPWYYSACPNCAKIAAQAVEDARLAAKLRVVIDEHLRRYPAAPSPPTGASWWALARHEDKLFAARNAAYAALSTDVHNTQAYERLDIGGVFSMSGRPEWVREVEAAARAAVPFVDEPTPGEAGGTRVGLSKGCASVTAPAGAVARRGGGESSYVAFYDAEGAMLAAYTTESQGPSTWPVTCSAAQIEARFARWYYPIAPVGKTAAERATQAIFGGA